MFSIYFRRFEIQNMRFFFLSVYFQREQKNSNKVKQPHKNATKMFHYAPSADLLGRSIVYTIVIQLVFVTGLKAEPFHCQQQLSNQKQTYLKICK